MVVSFIGLESQEVTIKPTVKVVLRSDAEQLDEVVVTAMGIKRSEKALGYSATSVNGEVTILFSALTRMFPKPTFAP